jgi:lysophospholipase L1-like esterase
MNRTMLNASVRSYALVLLFLLTPALCPAAAPTFAPVKAELIRPRAGLGNVLSKLQAGEPVKIAYFGGSITAAPGWRVQTLKWFQEQFPQAKVEEINAAIGGTGSDLGVFRLGHDALAHQPDLVFVEFAVNDGGASPQNIWRGMEGIVRQTWAANPHTDLCFVYTFRTGYEKELSQGVCPQAASAMEMLADHYGIPSINVALKIVELQQAGKLIYKADQPPGGEVVHFSTDGVHPLEGGHRLYTEVVAQAVRQMTAGAKAASHEPKLASPFVDDHWQAAKMVPLDETMLSGNWQKLPTDAGLGKAFGGRMGTIWEADAPGSKLSFKFRGSIARIYDLLGPDGGQVTITVDGKTREKPVPRFDSYCTYHRIATLSVAEGVAADQVHTVTIEIHPEQPDRTPVAFRLKNPEEELKAPKYQGTKVRAAQILVLGDLVDE